MELLREVGSQNSPQALAQEEEAEAKESGQAMAHTDPGANHDLQRRVRSLLLRALRMWRTSHYDFRVIEHVLGFVHVKIDKFEEKVGDIQDAAAGSSWLAIKDVIGELLQGVACCASGLQACEDRREPLFRRFQRQSGVRNICWKKETASWRVQWQEAGKRKQLNFLISKHMKEGLSEEEAVAASLEEAKVWREELVRQGKLQPSKPKATGSTVIGVTSNTGGTFRVVLTNPHTKKREGGTFKTLVEAEAKAWELAKKWGLHDEEVQRLSEVPHFEPLGPEKNVRWVLGEKAWHAQCNVGGKNRHKRCRPKDLSAKEVEKAWNQAVAWRKQREKERADRAPKR